MPLEAFAVILGGVIGLLVLAFMWHDERRKP